MSILKLKPALKDYIWGGTALADKYKKADRGSKIAETWELSCYPDSPSVIENGEFAGKTLSEYIAIKGRGILGSSCGRFDSFPVLIKLIDAADRLSIQVHPDNDYALSHEGQYGKTEMWYIVEAEEGAYIYYGFKRAVSREELRDRIENNTVLEVLNAVPVHKGDVFFIEAGTVHSIGRGILTMEIQQSSDITYRIYDYGRLDKEGKPRALHIDKALEVASLTPVKAGADFTPHIGRCEYFTVDRIEADGGYRDFVDEKSFLHLLFLGGEGRISLKDEFVDYKAGDSVFLPAGSGELRIDGSGEIIATYESE